MGEKGANLSGAEDVSDEEIEDSNTRAEIDNTDGEKQEPEAGTDEENKKEEEEVEEEVEESGEEEVKWIGSLS